MESDDILNIFSENSVTLWLNGRENYFVVTIWATVNEFALPKKRWIIGMLFCSWQCQTGSLFLVTAKYSATTWTICLSDFWLRIGGCFVSCCLLLKVMKRKWPVFLVRAMAVHKELGKRTKEHNKITELKGNFNSNVWTMIDSLRSLEI